MPRGLKYEYGKLKLLCNLYSYIDIYSRDKADT